jgi:FtsH-binding integral membrane protein
MSSQSHTPEPAPASPEEIREIQKHIVGYWKIFAVQVAFAIAMVGISFINFSSSAAQVAATLFVAALNGILVAGILMHLKEEKRTIWKFLIFTGVFFFILFFLTYLARTDLITHTLHNHH